MIHHHIHRSFPWEFPKAVGNQEPFKNPSYHSMDHSIVIQQPTLFISLYVLFTMYLHSTFHWVSFLLCWLKEGIIKLCLLGSRRYNSDLKKNSGRPSGYWGWIPDDHPEHSHVINFIWVWHSVPQPCLMYQNLLSLQEWAICPLPKMTKDNALVWFGYKWKRTFWIQSSILVDFQLSVCLQFHLYSVLHHLSICLPAFKLCYQCPSAVMYFLLLVLY